MDSATSDPSWVRKGVCDLKHMSDKVKRHKASFKHLNNCLDFFTIGKVNITSQLNSDHRQHVAEHNEKVTKNRHILSRLIDCIKFCGIFDVALHSDRDFETSSNPGIFRGLVNLLSEIDGTLKEYINQTNNSLFMGLSETIQNELLDSIYAVARDLIKSEIDKTDYIAIMADETTDSSTPSQLVFIVRYELDGQIHERFLGFLFVNGHSAEAIAKAILNELESIGIHENIHKLIAQSYDGVTVMSHKDHGVQAKVKHIYDIANYIHCYAHPLDLVIERAASQNKRTRIFFSNIQGFTTFFSTYPKRAAILEKLVKKRLSTTARRLTKTFDIKNRCLSTVHDYKEDLIKCLEQIIDDPTCDRNTTRDAVALNAMLDDPEFNYWLDFFNKIMRNCEAPLYFALESPYLNGSNLRKDVLAFKRLIQQVADEAADLPMPQEKRLRCQDENDQENKEVSDSSGQKAVEKSVARQKRPRCQDDNDHVTKEVSESAFKQSGQKVIEEAFSQQKRPSSQDETDRVTQNICDCDYVLKVERDPLITQQKRPGCHEENDHDYIVKQEVDSPEQKRPRYHDDNSQVSDLVGNSIIDHEYIIKDEKEVYEQVNKSTVCEAVVLENPRNEEDENKQVNVLQEVCDAIATNVEDRFRFTDHLSVAALFQPKLFSRYQLLFPDQDLDLAVAIFNLDRYPLRQELSVIYSRSEFSSAYGALTILQCFYDNHLCGSFPESTKLLKIICTMPMTTVECDRSFSTLKRVKKFVANTACENQLRLNALAMCSIEKKLLVTKVFNELVIDHFAKTKQEFVYKKFN